MQITCALVPIIGVLEGIGGAECTFFKGHTWPPLNPLIESSINQFPCVVMAIVPDVVVHSWLGHFMAEEELGPLLGWWWWRLNFSFSFCWGGFTLCWGSLTLCGCLCGGCLTTTTNNNNTTIRNNNTTTKNNNTIAKN